MDASEKQKQRLVIDYRKLNEKTIDDRYPLPNITDIEDRSRIPRLPIEAALAENKKRSNDVQDYSFIIDDLSKILQK